MKQELVQIPNGELEIQRRIMSVRSVQVMLDRDLAELYGVELKALNQAVKRNAERFPERFMHQLTKDEFADLKSQIATSSQDSNLSHLKSQFVTSSWGGVRKPPKVFTEQGVSMLSAVLHRSTIRFGMSRGLSSRRSRRLSSSIRMLTRRSLMCCRARRRA